MASAGKVAARSAGPESLVALHELRTYGRRLAGLRRRRRKPALTWSGGGDLNSRPLRPEVSPGELARPFVDESAGRADTADHGDQGRRERPAGWTRDATLRAGVRSIAPVTLTEGGGEALASRSPHDGGPDEVRRSGFGKRPGRHWWWEQPGQLTEVCGRPSNIVHAATRMAPRAARMMSHPRMRSVRSHIVQIGEGPRVRSEPSCSSAHVQRGPAGTSDQSNSPMS